MEKEMGMASISIQMEIAMKGNLKMIKGINMESLLIQPEIAIKENKKIISF